MIYLDNSATTKLLPEVLDEMMPYLTYEFANASSSYSFADMSKIAIHDARCRVAKLINANPSEIYFTSGGSESDNWALKGVVETGDHIITSCIEHPAILNTCKYLEDIGVEVTYLRVDKYGMVSVSDLKEAIKPNTKLVSIMFANNEIGTLQYIDEIGEVCRDNGVIFHTDAVQACGHYYIDVDKLHIDMLSASGHKFGAPKGVGFLYIRKDIKITPLIHGGHQEHGLRAGTYNTAGIVGLGKACEIAMNNLKYENFTEFKKRQIKFIGKLFERFPELKELNGGRINRTANNINVTFDKIDGEILMSLLNEQGIYVSTGSACMSSDKTPSYVLKAIGRTDDEANSSIRISMSEDTTDKEIDEFIVKLRQCIDMAKILKE